MHCLSDKNIRPWRSERTGGSLYAKLLVAMLNGHVGIIDNFAGNNFVGNTLITGR